MKNFQQNLFVAVAVALCGLCAWQWYFQTAQRDRIDHLDQLVFKQATAIQGYTNSLESMDAEMSGHQARIDELKRTVKTNELEILNEKREVLRLKYSAETLSNEIAQYQSLTNLLTGKLQDAYDGVRKQNEAVAKLVSERDEFVGKYNESVKARNEVVEKYNDLVAQVKKIEDAQKAGGGK